MSRRKAAPRRAAHNQGRAGPREGSQPLSKPAVSDNWYAERRRQSYQQRGKWLNARDWTIPVVMQGRQLHAPADVSYSNPRRLKSLRLQGRNPSRSFLQFRSPLSWHCIQHKEMADESHSQSTQTSLTLITYQMKLPNSLFVGGDAGRDARTRNSSRAFSAKALPHTAIAAAITTIHPGTGAE